MVPQDVAKLHAEAFPLAKCRATKDVPSRLKFMKMMKDWKKKRRTLQFDLGNSGCSQASCRSISTCKV